MSDLTFTLLLVGAVLAVPACADDIRPVPELDAGGAPAGKVATVRNPDGTYTTRIDATAVDAWTAIDVETGAEPADATSWDLAAQRFHLKLNGGVSGGAGVEVASVAGALAEVTAAPAAGWITDQADGADDGAEPDYAFEQDGSWYAYDVATHVLTPRPIVWVVRTGDRRVIALAVDDYYDDAGSSGHFTLSWKVLAGGGA